MNTVSQYLRQYWLSFILCALTVYFLLAALQGNTGLFRLAQLSAQIETANEEFERLNTERVRLENLTHRLSDNYLDLDLLDEQARRRLGLVREDEIIVR